MTVRAMAGGVASFEQPAGGGGSQRDAHDRESELEHGHVAEVPEVVVVGRREDDVGAGHAEEGEGAGRGREGHHPRMSLLADEPRGEAIEAFFRATAMPDEAIEDAWHAEVVGARGARADACLRLGGDGRHGARRRDPCRARRPCRATGSRRPRGESPPFMLEIGRQLADLLPHGEYRVIEGQGHVVDPRVLAPILAEFLAAESRQG